MALINYEELYRQTDGERLEVAIGPIVRRGQELLDENWQRAVDESVDAFGITLEDGATVSIALAGLAAGLGAVVTSAEAARLRTLVDSAYRVVKRRISNVLKVDFVVDDIDDLAIRTIAKEPVFWINGLYNNQMSERLAAVAREVAIEKELTGNAASRALSPVVRQELALAGGHTKFAKNVPGRFNGNERNYSKVLTANLTNRAINYSSLISMSQARIERYEVVAVLDNRTSEVCRNMNGRTFTVQQGMDTFTALANANSPEEFKNISPWMTVDQIRNTPDLADAGLALPPYHGL